MPWYLRFTLEEESQRECRTSSGAYTREGALISPHITPDMAKMER